MGRLVWAGLALVLVTLGCKELQAPPAAGQPVTARGELVAGTECPLIVTADGHRYSVAGDLGRFKVGDRVCIKGSIAEVSYCMAGEATIALQSIGPEDACP